MMSKGRSITSKALSSWFISRSWFPLEKYSSALTVRSLGFCCRALSRAFRALHRHTQSIHTKWTPTLSWSQCQASCFLSVPSGMPVKVTASLEQKSHRGWQKNPFNSWYCEPWGHLKRVGWREEKKVTQRRECLHWSEAQLKKEVQGRDYFCPWERAASASTLPVRQAGRQKRRERIQELRSHLWTCVRISWDSMLSRGAESCS